MVITSNAEPRILSRSICDMNVLHRSISVSLAFVSVSKHHLHRAREDNGAHTRGMSSKTKLTACRSPHASFNQLYSTLIATRPVNISLKNRKWTYTNGSPTAQIPAQRPPNSPKGKPRTPSGRSDAPRVGFVGRAVFFFFFLPSEKGFPRYKVHQSHAFQYNPSNGYEETNQGNVWCWHSTPSKEDSSHSLMR